MRGTNRNAEREREGTVIAVVLLLHIHQIDRIKINKNKIEDEK